MRHVLWWLLLFGAVMWPAAAPAQDPAQQSPFDPVRVKEMAAGWRCYRHARYLVVERELKESGGADLFIRLASSERCDADSLPGDLVIRNEWAEYFAGLRGHVLFLDSGTGPDLRGLILFDLRSRRRIAELSYVDLEAGLDSLTIGIWSGFELERVARGCPPPQGGLLPGIDSLFWVSVETGALRYAGRTRCAVRQ